MLANHAPFMTTLRNGVVRVLDGDTVKMRIFVRGGFADITSEGLTILAEEASMLDDVKVEDVQAEMEATLLKILALDKDDSSRATLQEHYDYLESMKLRWSTKARLSRTRTPLRKGRRFLWPVAVGISPR